MVLPLSKTTEEALPYSGRKAAAINSCLFFWLHQPYYAEGLEHCQGIK